MSATPTGAAADGGLMAMAVNFAPFIVILVLFYFMLIDRTEPSAPHSVRGAVKRRRATLTAQNKLKRRYTLSRRRCEVWDPDRRIPTISVP